MGKLKLQLANQDVKYMWCMDPVVGFHIFGVLNFVGLIMTNVFVYDEGQLIYLILLNCLVFTPVIMAYLIALIKGTQRRESRKTFFYACCVNNIGVIGLVITILVLLAT